MSAFLSSLTGLMSALVIPVVAIVGGVSFAVTVTMWQVSGDNSFWWGLVLIAWGLGRLVSEARQTPGPPPQAGSGPPPSGTPYNR